MGWGLGVWLFLIIFLIVFNHLFKKWVWKFVNETNSLWVKFIHAIYGFEGGFRLEDDEDKMVGTWPRILDTINHLHDKCLDFHLYLKKKVGNGFMANFWKDVWTNDVYFLSLFSILVLPFPCFSSFLVFYLFNCILYFDLRVKYKKSISCYCYFRWYQRAVGTNKKTLTQSDHDRR